MNDFELTNEQRKYFGLDPVQKHWERVILNGDVYRPQSILYYDSFTIKRQIISTNDSYKELQFDELTRNRSYLLPKTKKGKEKKLSSSVLEQRQPKGVYLLIANGLLTIGNYTTQTTFYASDWNNENPLIKSIPEIISDFIDSSPSQHLIEIENFKSSERKNIKYKAGDYFAFKLDRSNFGFGRIILDVNAIRKRNLVMSTHGLNLIMGPPIIVELFVYRSETKNIDINFLDAQPKLPSDVMMDNLIFYSEFEIIGHKKINFKEVDFPISYGRSIDQRPVVFLQWGLIHKELPISKFDKYISGEKKIEQNPFGFYSNGFSPHYGRIEIIKALNNNGVFEFDKSTNFKAKQDLRNPRNVEIKYELFRVFRLDPEKSYYENSLLSNTKLPDEIFRN